MTNPNRQRGLPQDSIETANRLIRDMETELLLTPGSQPRITIQTDELSMLLKVARDGILARKLFDALTPAHAELTDIGRAHTVPEAGKALVSFNEQHPEITCIRISKY